MAVVPTPVRRVLRDRPRLVAVALLALVSLAAAGINVTAADRLQSLLDANWRGSYDILVTAEGGEVAGLLPPNSLAAGSEGMTLEDLESIRSLDGIEVAAPIGEVIVPGLATAMAQIALPRGEAGANEVPQAFRVTMTYRTNDGLGERLVSSEAYDIVVDETQHPEPEPEPCNFNGFDVDPDEYPTLARMCGGGQGHSIVSGQQGNGSWGTGDVEGDTVLFTLGNALLPTTRITLVDPVAERALLGDAGDFLDPLAELSADGPAPLPAITAWAESAENVFSRTFRKQQDALAAAQLGFPSDQLEELKRLYAANGSTFEYETVDPQYVPMVVRDTGPAPFSISIGVEAFGPAPAITSQPDQLAYQYPYHMPAAMSSGAAGDDLGSEEIDASALLNPFSADVVMVPWPGTSTEGLEGMPWVHAMNLYITGTAGAPAFVVESDDADGVEVRMRSSGYLSPIFTNNHDFSAALVDDGAKPGMESAFASSIKASPTMGDGGMAAVAVGGFTLDAIAEQQQGLGHVPLGAYGAVGSTLIPGSSEAAAEAVELNPSVSGMGLVSADTVAIASIASASALGQNAAINAVRVRVADVDSFSTSGVAAIAEVAQQLEKLGFTATIVAGSSPTDVTVHVDDYAFGVTDPGEKQQIGPLGAVSQKWSELGAAARVDLAVSTSSLGVLAVALAASALLLAAVQLASVPGRRAQASVMRTIGWRRRRILQWMAAEELVSLVLVALAALAALVLAGMRPTVGLVVAVSVAALVVTSVLAVVLGARPAAGGIRPLSRGKRQHREAELSAWVTSSFRFSVRQLVVHRVGAIVQLLATVVVGVSAAAVTITIIEGRAAAGASALGDFASSQAFISQVGLGLVALVAGIALAVIARRIDLDARREQWATMRAMGFSVGQLRMVQLTEGLLIGLPAIALATAASWFYGGAVALELRASSLPVALAAAAVLTIILVLTSWREKR